MKVYGIDIDMTNAPSPRCPAPFTRHVFSTKDKRDAFLSAVVVDLRKVGIHYEEWESDVD